jgi:copper resistance protein B
MNTLTLSLARLRRVLLALLLAVCFAPAHAQEMDHPTMQMPPVTTTPAQKPAPEQDTQTEPTNHSAMGHETPMPQEPAQPMDHSAMGHDTPMPSDQPRQPIPPLTEADRIAAFPDVAGHPAHDKRIQKFVLLDRLEGWNADDGNGFTWETLGWLGTDLNRFWLRSEGDRVDDRIESADVEVLYGRSIARWWDVVAGVRHDFGAGPSQTFVAIGVMGLTPYKFDVEGTAYIGESGQTAARFEADYDTLLTNRLILQWLVEADLYGKDDPRRGIGSGLSTVEAGLRLRYEFTRKFAPYIGVAWERAYAGTADFRRNEGEAIDDTRVVAGFRIWF